MYPPRILFILFISFTAISSLAQTSNHQTILTFQNQKFEMHHVKGKIIKFKGKKVLRLERDLESLPFEANRLEETVDERHYARLLDLNDFENGTIEVKMYSQILEPSPYPPAAGFIGVYFRIQEDDSAFESIYLRPKVGRILNQYARNHAVQYFSYPNYKFQTLRDKFPAGTFEGSAPVALGEWINMRVEIQGNQAEMFINDSKYSTFVVSSMLGKNTSGYVGLYVDIGTVGYFRDLKITKRKVQNIKNTTKSVDSI